MIMHTLPVLQYNFNALEPYIDAETMRIHHDKHHQAYVDKLNAALDKHPELYNQSLISLLQNLESVPEDIRTAVRNHGGGHFNHSFFWQILKINNNEEPGEELMKAITRDFISFDNFKKQFTETASTQFGSGWTWLSLNGEGKLEIQSTPLQDNPIMNGGKPILGLDVWEHAYYLKYQNRRAEYVEAFWSIINWEEVNSNFQSL
ncbi:superoxide dismutase [Candidatus Falkowbacteria bacterium]|nr:MAG: superoxide dismutase [Candidatus Falkowbacteria bacterium]